jgi:hypothetical protein
MELSYIHYILTGYFAARVLIGFRRWSLAVDALFIGFISAYMWRDAPLLLLALPFFLGVVAVGAGVFSGYAGLASAFSIYGVYLMFQPAPHLKALGFVLAILSPAALLPTLRDRGSIEGFFRYLVISSFASAFLFIGLGQRGSPLGEAFLFPGGGAGARDGPHVSLGPRCIRQVAPRRARHIGEPAEALRGLRPPRL